MSSTNGRRSAVAEVVPMVIAGAVAEAVLGIVTGVVPMSTAA